MTKKPTKNLRVLFVLLIKDLPVGTVWEKRKVCLDLLIFF